MASSDGRLAVVRYLVDKGADVRALDNEALRMASYNGHLPVVQFLVQNGADVHANDDDALQAASENGNLEIVQFLVLHRANVRANDDKALRLASAGGFLLVVQFLVDNGANVRAHNDEAIQVAYDYGHLDVAQFLRARVGAGETRIRHWFFDEVAPAEPQPRRIPPDDDPLCSISLEPINVGDVYVKCTNRRSHYFSYEAYEGWCTVNRLTCIQCPMCTLPMDPHKYVNQGQAGYGMTQRRNNRINPF